MEFKEYNKSPDVRHGHIKKNGSISYAILPRQVLPGSDLKAIKKIKSPSPSIKLAGPASDVIKLEPGDHPLQRLRSP